MHPAISLIGLVALTATACVASDSSDDTIEVGPSDSNRSATSTLPAPVRSPAPASADQADSNSDDLVGSLRAAAITGCEVKFGPGAKSFWGAGHVWYSLEPGAVLDTERDAGTNDPVLLAVTSIADATAQPEQREFVIIDDFVSLTAEASAADSLTVVLGVTRATDLPDGWVEVVMALDDDDFAVLSDCSGTLEPFLREQLIVNGLDVADLFTSTAEEAQTWFDS